MLLALGTLACTDELEVKTPSERPTVIDKGIGQLVLFSAGNVGNVTSTTRADVIPFMETSGRFVCTMYYHGNAGASENSPFVVDDENSRATSYMKVFDVHNPEAKGTESLGNSVYWKQDYTELEADDLQEETYKTYGFDPRVEPFYWKNRLPHVFVAYTDYNQLQNITYSTTTKEGETVPVQGSLFMYPDADGVRKVKTGETVEWDPQKATVFAFRRNIMTLNEYNDANDSDITEDDFNALPDAEKYAVPAVWTLTEVKENQSPVALSPHKLVFDETVHTSVFAAWLDHAKSDIEAAINNASDLSDEKKAALLTDLRRIAPTADEGTVNGTFHNSCWTVTFDDNKNIVVENQTEGQSETRIDLSDPTTVVYFSYEKKRVEETILEQPANTFDLTRGERTSMAQQPDPILAVTKMKPTGATQEANRVRLYFKHQFSQIQVNVQKVDNTYDLEADNIESVELLGVTKTGYVFTLPNSNGEAIAPAYEAVDVSKLTAEQYAQNRYGTSFNMFEMAAADKPTSSLKSFNAIAFGMLQALRITWKEPLPDSETDTSKQIKHTVIFPISTDEHGISLTQLQSGKRYVYDIRLARGILASIRVSIEGWGLSEDLNYREDGIISD